MTDSVSKSGKLALQHLKDHWHIGMPSVMGVADLLDINRNTFKTRVARGQALALREANGELRSTLVFTGYHLVYNLISDRLLRYGFPVDHDDKTLAAEPHIYANWVYEHVLTAPYHTSAVLKFSKDSTGKIMCLSYLDGEPTLPYSDGALILPIGHMVFRLAATLHMRASPASYQTAPTLLNDEAPH